MKKQIRIGVFETNSSSTHAVAILNEEEYAKYQKGDLLISRYGDVTPAEEVGDIEDNYEYDQDEMEIEHVVRTINGVTVHALSVYGYDS